MVRIDVDDWCELERHDQIAAGAMLEHAFFFRGRYCFALELRDHGSCPRCHRQASRLRSPADRAVYFACKCGWQATVYDTDLVLEVKRGDTLLALVAAANDA